MDPSGLIPTAEAIPVHWGWFKFLLILTFLLHILLMNLMLGGSLLTFARRLRGGAAPPEAHGLPSLIALTINMGVPPLLFMQVLFGQFLYTSSVLMAVAWILVIPILILAYYAAYGFLRQEKRGLGTLWLGISTLFLLFIGFMLSNNMTLMLRPERWGVYFARPDGTFLNLSEPTLIPRYLHFVLASVAVAALGRAVFHRVRAMRGESASPEEMRGGLRLFAWMTMIQMLIGILFWIVLPGSIGKLFLGTSIVHTAHLWLGILLGIFAILAALRGKVWTTTGLLLGTVLMMILVRDLVRTAYLAPVFHPRDLAVAQQLSPFILFLISFVVVVGVLVYMLRHAWRAKA